VPKPKSVRHMRIDENRRRIYLDRLAMGDSPVSAARAASPHCIGNDFGLGGFRELAKRDPEFAAQVAAAKEAALADVEDEIRRRAMNPPLRPVWHKGQLVGHYEERLSSDKLLLRLAEKLDPEHWAPQSRIKSEVDVTVRGVMLAIRPEDVFLLDSKEQDTFVELLTKIADRRDEPSAELPLSRSKEVSDGEP